jgi:hypothetical protein
LAPLASIVVLLVAAAPSQAQQIVGRLWINQAARVGNASLNNVPPQAPDAWFNPPEIDFDSRDDGYTINQFLKFPTFYNTSPQFDPDGTSNNLFYYFTGSLFLLAGNNQFVIPHDDGLQLFIDQIGLVVDQPGPTAPVETPFNVVAPQTGLYTFQLSYAEGFGPPGVLGWRINGAPVGNPVPDGGATAALLSLGVLGVGIGRRLTSRK